MTSIIKDLLIESFRKGHLSNADIKTACKKIALGPKKYSKFSKTRRLIKQLAFTLRK